MGNLLHHLSYAVVPRTREADERLYPYQRAAVEQILMRERQHALLGHHPGAGKTPMGLIVAQQAINKNRKVVIVVPPSLRDQWARKVEEWLPRVSLKTCESAQDVKDWDFAPAQVTILPDSLLHHANPMEGATVIIDEMHRFKDRASRRTVALYGGQYKGQALLGVTRACSAVVALTGTPVIASPVDLYPFLHAVGFADAAKFGPFCDKYCPPYEVTVGSHSTVKYDQPLNLPELASKLRETFLIRPRREEYLGQMPEITEDSVFIDIPDPGDDLSPEEVTNMAHTGNIAQSTQIAKIRRQIGVAKANAVAPIISDMIAGCDRPILWCWHREVAELLATTCDGLAVHGGMDIASRQKAVQQFINGETPMLAMTISAMGTGLDGLQHATDLCIFVERSFVPAENEQALARIHRHGQLHAVRVYYVDTHTTVDLAVARANAKKTHNATETLR